MTSVSKPAPSPWTYVDFGIPDFEIVPNEPKFRANIFNLQSLLEKRGLWKLLGASFREQDGIPILRFPGYARILLRFAGLSPEFRHYIYSPSGASSIWVRDVLSPSSAGLVESRPSVEAFRAYVHKSSEEARNFLKSKGAIKHVKFQMPKLGISSEIATLLEIFHTHKFKIACLGECHPYESPKQFMHENLPALKKMGVKAVAVEAVFYVMQPLLDYYFSNPSAEMPSILLNYLQFYDRLYGTPESCGMVAFVRKAKEIGIRVIALETIGAESAGGPMTEESNYRARVVTFNTDAFRILAHEAPKDGTMMLWTGALHTVSYHTENGDIPGLSELLQCPVVYVDQKAKPGVPDPKEVFLKGGYTFDVHITRPV